MKETMEHSTPSSVPEARRRFTEWLEFPFSTEWWRKLSEHPMKVEEFRENGTLVVRVELPGVDPDKDVAIEVADGMLYIRAERKQETKAEEKLFRRTEFSYGSFSRSIPLPAGVSEADVKASYRDGILEVRLPMPPAEKTPATRIEVTRA